MRRRGSRMTTRPSLTASSSFCRRIGFLSINASTAWQVEDSEEPPIQAFQFETVKHWRIVARGDHDAAESVLRLYRQGHGGRRRRLGSQRDLKTIAGKYFGDAPTKVVGEKPPVVTDDHFFCRALDGNGAPSNLPSPG